MQKIVIHPYIHVKENIAASSELLIFFSSIFQYIEIWNGAIKTFIYKSLELDTHLQAKDCLQLLDFILWRKALNLLSCI